MVTLSNLTPLLTLLSVATAACPSEAIPTTGVFGSVNKVQSRVSVLNNLVVNWSSNNGILGALGIQNSYFPLESAVNSLSSAVGGVSSVSACEADLYLHSLASLVGEITTLLHSLSAKAADFGSVGAAAIVAGDIHSLGGPAAKIESQILRLIPSDVDCTAITSASSLASVFAREFAAAASKFSTTVSGFPSAPTTCKRT